MPGPDQPPEDPRYVPFTESYPLTASGKAQKFVLRERAIKALGLEDVANVRTASRLNVERAVWSMETHPPFAHA